MCIPADDRYGALLCHRLQHAPLKSPSNSYWASFECDNQMIAFDILSLKKNSLINCPERHQQQPILSMNAAYNISRSKSPFCCRRSFVHGEKLRSFYVNLKPLRLSLIQLSFHFHLLGCSDSGK